MIHTAPVAAEGHTMMTMMTIQTDEHVVLAKQMMTKRRPLEAQEETGEMKTMMMMTAAAAGVDEREAMMMKTRLQVDHQGQLSPYQLDPAAQNPQNL